MYKILVLGGSGLVGKAIINEINKSMKYEVYATYNKSTVPLNEDRCLKLNVDHLDNLDGILNTLKPQSVISCLRGNYDKQLVLHTKVAEYLEKIDGSLYFCSTTNVFDNDVSEPHYEDDLQNSCTEYGQYKVACEKRMIEILHDNACILRLPQIWGKGSARMKQLKESLNNNEKIVVYPKLWINTNTDIAIAKKVLYIIEHHLKGIFHLAADDVINYEELFRDLIMGLGFTDDRMEENFEEDGCLAILSKRNNEFPEELRVTNKSVIHYLLKSATNRM